ncbi:MAG TPA: FMN-binding protein [Candidatus Sulfotelmatobacter sp.]|jgi:uncharacterized protein with FMN-binding domain|nr:FMN-binding protein [Candidatus Sulfotelmatobacter sp.]
MKKIIISVVVIISFISYALSIQKKGVVQTPGMAPSTIGKSKITAVPIDVTPSLTTVKAKMTAIPQPIIPTVTHTSNSQYKDGTYKGSVADAIYGNIQVQITILGGKITDVQFLQYPNDRDTSISINQQADPLLAQEAIQAQNISVDIVSGATDTSQAFIQSLQSALNQAKM